MRIKAIILSFIILLTSCATNPSYSGNPWDPEAQRTYNLGDDQYESSPECFLIDGINQGWQSKTANLRVYCRIQE
jgi:hypothetical protein